MDKPLLGLTPPPKQEAAKPRAAAPPIAPQPAPEAPSVECQFMTGAIKTKRMLRFQHLDGTVTEGIPVAVDRD